jgi:hypothetical protein
MESLIKSAPAVPKDTTFPFPLSKDSIYLLLRLIELHVYIQDGILGYVLLLYLVNRGTFDIYRLIPIPMDWSSQAILLLKESDWMNSCNLLNSRSNVYKQNQPFLSSHLQENCVVLLLQSKGIVPPPQLWPKSSGTFQLSLDTIRQ